MLSVNVLKKNADAELAFLKAITCSGFVFIFLVRGILCLTFTNLNSMAL